MMSEGPLVAVIDVGSNSVRLLVARQLTPTAFEVVDEERFAARIGQGQVDGFLTDEGAERGLRALRICAQVAAGHGLAETVAVGTEALRRAPNAAAFCASVFRETGLRVRMLTADEEAAASFLGVINSTQLDNGYILDIGGGSLEVITVEDREMVSAKSVPFGALYATERYFRSDRPTAKEVRALRRAVRLAVGDLPSRPLVIGVGGAVRNLARMQRVSVGYPLRRLHGLTLPRRAVQRMARALTATDADGRKRIAGINTDRIGSLPAAAVVIDEVLAAMGADAIEVSGQGLREGLVWQELRRANPIIADVRGASLAGLAHANGVSELAAEPVVNTARELFAATRRLHSLDDADLGLLIDGARLAGIGMHVDYYNRDRHAEYLVHSGDLHGFTHREIVLLGALVRFADGGTVTLAEYGRIVAPGDERRVATLAALLGLARALHRRAPSPVSRLEAALKKDTLVLRLAGSGPLDAEVYALERARRRFAEALGVSLELEVETGSATSQVISK